MTTEESKKELEGVDGVEFNDPFTFAELIVDPNIVFLDNQQCIVSVTDIRDDQCAEILCKDLAHAVKLFKCIVECAG